MPLSLRLATPDDLAAINDIYNHYISSSTTTYDEQPRSLEERRAWFAGHGGKLPVTVALRDDVVVGWGSLNVFRDRPGYRFTVENSVYVRDDCRGQGIGSRILADLIERARALGYHAIVAGIDAEQSASVALHAKFGFVEVARFPEIGFKFNRWLDVIFMELLLR